MSFLSILLVASAFYFANARPDSPSTPEALVDAIRAKVKVPEDVSTMVPKDNQHQLYYMMDEVKKSIDKYMTPLMTKVDVKKQDELKTMCLDGFASTINYVQLLIQEIENGKYKDGHSEFFDGSFPRNEIILEFFAPQPVSAPFIPSSKVDDD